MKASVLVFLLAAICAAQTSTSQSSGPIRDSTSAVVPNAGVTLTNESTGVALKQTTTDAGVYAFPAIPAGTYTVRVEANGFRTAVVAGRIVQVGTPLIADVQ